MGYSATCPPISKAEAEEFGQWLKQYAIEITGLQVWQIGASGHRYLNQPLADTMMLAGGQVAASAGSGAAGAMVGATAAGTGCLAFLAPIAAALAPVLAPLTLGAIILQPIALAGDHHNRKRSAETVLSVARNDPIVNTEIAFDLANVSPRRRQWTEYLIGRFAASHDWVDVKGFHYPAQLGAGSRALRDPVPWANGPQHGQAAPALMAYQAANWPLDRCAYLRRDPYLPASHPRARVASRKPAEAAPSSGGRVKRALRDLW